MSAPAPLRPDFEAALLCKLARQSRDPDQTRRLLALAEIYDGSSRSDAARIGGAGLQKEVPDPRVAGMVIDPLNEILLATLVGVLCGALIGTPWSF